MKLGDRIGHNFFDALPPPVALDDRRLKGLAPKLRNLEIDRASTGLQRAFIAASPGVLPSLATFVSCLSGKLPRVGPITAVESFVRRG
jgi:hypothetical protein